jgi:hypothetical protein
MTVNLNEIVELRTIFAAYGSVDCHMQHLGPCEQLWLVRSWIPSSGFPLTIYLCPGRCRQTQKTK